MDHLTPGFLFLHVAIITAFVSMTSPQSHIASHKSGDRVHSAAAKRFSGLALPATAAASLEHLLELVGETGTGL